MQCDYDSVVLCTEFEKQNHASRFGETLEVVCAHLGKSHAANTVIMVSIGCTMFRKWVCLHLELHVHLCVFITSMIVSHSTV